MTKVWTALELLGLMIALAAFIYGLSCWLRGGRPRCLNCNALIPPWDAYCPKCLNE